MVVVDYRLADITGLYVEQGLKDLGGDVGNLLSVMKEAMGQTLDVGFVVRIVDPLLEKPFFTPFFRIGEASGEEGKQPR